MSGRGNRTGPRGHRPRGAILKHEGGLVVRLPDDESRTLRQLRLLALMAQVDETEMIRRLVSAEAERVTGPAPDSL